MCSGKKEGGWKWHTQAGGGGWGGRMRGCKQLDAHVHVRANTHAHTKAQHVQCAWHPWRSTTTASSQGLRTPCRDTVGKMLDCDERQGFFSAHYTTRSSPEAERHYRTAGGFPTDLSITRPCVYPHTHLSNVYDVKPEFFLIRYGKGREGGREGGLVVRAQQCKRAHEQAEGGLNCMRAAVRSTSLQSLPPPFLHPAALQLFPYPAIPVA